MKRLAYRATAIALSLAVFGCTAPSPPSTGPAATPKAAPTAAAKAAPTAAAKAAATAAPSAPTAAEKAAPAAKPKSTFTFAGKTVTLLLGWSVGGDADITARQVQPFLGKYLPGNPTVVVQNMPGAAGLVGDNWVTNAAPKDGTFIGQPSTAFTNALFNPEQTKYDLAKLRWLGGFADTSVLYARPELGIKNAEDLPKVGQRIFIGMTTLGSNRDIPPVYLMRLLGVDHENVTGYASAGDLRAAVLRGEVQMTAASLPSYYSTVKPLVEQGQLIALAQAGILQDGKIVRDPRISDIPTYAEILVKVKGETVTRTVEYRAMELCAFLNGLLRGWIYAPGVPDDAFQATAAAFEKVLADPEWLQEFEKNVGYKPIALNASRAQTVANLIIERFNKETEALELIRKTAREG